MKVKMLSRNPQDYVRETNLDLHKVFRNYDPAQHPFEIPREYVRALNATKLDRVFAKPFLASLDGHKDSVSVICDRKTKLNEIFSGAYDGEIRQWNLTTKRCIRVVQAHKGSITGLTCSMDGKRLISVGSDCIIKHWDGDSLSDDSNTPIDTIILKSFATGIDHHWADDTYATSGQTVDIWNYQRSDPIKTYSWGVDTVNSVRFNPVEKSLCLSTVSDRSIMLYDLRTTVPINKVVLRMRSNTACWNPMEAYMFTAANEDHNLYTFDMRFMKSATRVHKDHTEAVLDVNYSPTGKEFVSGSYDKSIRIFQCDKSNSREVYHTKRMQRVFCVKWSADNRYVLSGSDEMNIRLWKANASEKIGTLRPREKRAFNYQNKIKQKFGMHPNIRRIARHRHVPKSIYYHVKEKRAQVNSIRRKEQNRRTHSKPGAVPIVPEREKNIVRTEVEL